MIEIKGLIKNYGTNPVLRGVDLQVLPGEFVTLVGPNGAGKSTLIRIVATLLSPTAGQVTIGGWPLTSHAGNVRRHIGYISHQPLLYGDLSAAENLSFYARLYRLDRQEERIQSALKIVGLLARQRDPVRSFSRGMLQRLAIARATLHEPDVLLFDEPYTGLDQDAAHLLDTLLNEEVQKGRTILMITHDLARGLNLSHRIAIMNRGKIALEMKRDKISPGDFLELYAEVTRKKQKR
jgi:heme exporter protein A